MFPVWLLRLFMLLFLIDCVVLLCCFLLLCWLLMCLSFVVGRFDCVCCVVFRFCVASVLMFALIVVDGRTLMKLTISKSCSIQSFVSVVVSVCLCCFA